MNLTREPYTPCSELLVFPAAAYYNLNDHDSRNGGAYLTSKKSPNFLSLESKLRKLSDDSLESVSIESELEETPHYIEEGVFPVLQNIAPIRYELRGFDDDEQQTPIGTTSRRKRRRIKSTRESKLQGIKSTRDPKLQGINYDDDIKIIRNAKPYRFIMETPADYIREEIIERSLDTLEEKLASIPTKEKTELDLSFILDEVLNNVFDYTKEMNPKKVRFHTKDRKAKTVKTPTRDYIHEDTQPDRDTIKVDTADVPTTREYIHGDTQPDRDAIKVDTVDIPRMKQKVKDKKRRISPRDPYTYIKKGLEYKHDMEVKSDSSSKGRNKARKIFKEYLFGESEPSSSGTTSGVFDNIKSFGHTQLKRTLRVCTMRRYPEKTKLRGREGYYLPVKCDNFPCKSTAENVCSRIFPESTVPDTETPSSRVKEQIHHKVKEKNVQLLPHRSGGCHCCMRVPSSISNSPDPKRGCTCQGEIDSNTLESSKNTTRKSRIPGIAETDEGKIRKKNPKICIQETCPEVIDETEIHGTSGFLKFEDGDIVIKGNIRQKGPSRENMKVCTENTCPGTSYFDSGKSKFVSRRYSDESSNQDCVCQSRVIQTDSSYVIKMKSPRKCTRNGRQNADQNQIKSSHDGKDRTSENIDENFPVKDSLLISSKTKIGSIEICNRKCCPETVEKMKIIGAFTKVKQEPTKKMISVCTQDTCPTFENIDENFPVKYSSSTSSKTKISSIEICNRKCCPETVEKMKIIGALTKVKQEPTKKMIRVCTQDTCPIRSSVEKDDDKEDGDSNVSDNHSSNASRIDSNILCSEKNLTKPVVNDSREPVSMKSSPIKVERGNDMSVAKQPELSTDGKEEISEFIEESIPVKDSKSTKQKPRSKRIRVCRGKTCPEAFIEIEGSGLRSTTCTYDVNKKLYKQKPVKGKVKVCSRDTCPEALFEIEGNLKSFHSSSKETEVSEIGDTDVSNDEPDEPIGKSVKILTPDDIAEDIKPGIKNKRSRSVQTVPRDHVREPHCETVPSKTVELVEKRASEKKDAPSQRTSDAMVGVSSGELVGEFTGTICEKKPCKGGIDFCIQKSCPETIVKTDEKQGKRILERTCTPLPRLREVVDEIIRKKNVASEGTLTPEIDEGSKRSRRKCNFTLCKKKPRKKGSDLCIPKSYPETIVESDEEQGEQTLERTCGQTPLPRIPKVPDEKIKKKKVISEKKPKPKIDASSKRTKKNLDVTICKNKPCERGIDFCIQKSCPETVVDNIDDKKHGKRVPERSYTQALYPKISEEALDKNIEKENVPSKRTQSTIIGESPEQLKDNLDESTCEKEVCKKRLDFCMRKSCPVIGRGDDEKISEKVLEEALSHAPEQLERVIEGTSEQSDVPTSPLIPTKSLSNTNVALPTTKTSDMEQNIQEILKEVMKRLLVLEEKAKSTAADKLKSTGNESSSSDSEQEAIENNLNGIFHVCHKRNIPLLNLPSNLNVLYTNKNRPQFEISIDKVATFVVPLNEILASMLDKPITLSEIEVGIVDRKKTCQKRRCEAIKREVIVTILNYRLLFETEIFRKVSLSYGHMKMTL